LGLPLVANYLLPFYVFYEPLGTLGFPPTRSCASMLADGFGGGGLELA